MGRTPDDSRSPRDRAIRTGGSARGARGRGGRGLHPARVSGPSLGAVAAIVLVGVAVFVGLAFVALTMVGAVARWSETVGMIDDTPIGGDSAPIGFNVREGASAGEIGEE